MLSDSPKKPLDDAEINDLLVSPIPIVKYAELADYDIEALLEPQDAFMILYEISRNNGHWVLVFRRGNQLHVYDSYGVTPDYEQKWADAKLLGRQNRLTEMLLDYNTQYNPYRHQQFSPDIATCGRHAIMRLTFRHLSDDQYNKFIRESAKRAHLTLDQLVSAVIR